MRLLGYIICIASLPVIRRNASAEAREQAWRLPGGLRDSDRRAADLCVAGRAIQREDWIKVSVLLLIGIGSLPGRKVVLRTEMSRTAVFIIFMLGTFCLEHACANGVPLADRNWQEISSGNFRIKSVLAEEETIELLRHLEVMRASLGDSNEISTYESQVPTIILAVDNHDDYVSIGAPDFSAGYFISDLRENAILIEHTAGSRGIQIILHEYAHYLNKQSGQIRFPRWFEEGNAEYLSYSRVRDQAFEYGMAPQGHLASLNFMSWMPLATLLATDDTSAMNSDDAALFYGQSWLMVHYLRSLPDADQTLPASLARYARLASTGTPPSEAFSQAFAVDLEDFEQALLQYFLRKKFASRSVSVNTALPGFLPQVAKMSRPEAQLALAHMAFRLENFDAAENWFTAVLDDDESACPRRSRAWADPWTARRS